MQRLSKLTRQERIDALCNAIRKKCRHGISFQQLERIISGINPNRTYFIKTTSDCEKFLNIATAEFIATPEKMTISYITPLYGRFRRGTFSKYGDITLSEPGVMFGKHAAAALKKTIYHRENELPGVTYTLVILEQPFIN